MTDILDIPYHTLADIFVEHHEDLRLLVWDRRDEGKVVVVAKRTDV